MAAVKIWAHFDLLQQQWTIEEISILSNSSHLEWRVELSDTILKWDYPRTIPARFGLIWFSGFRGKDLNVIFYQNMSNLYNQYKSVEEKNSRKNPEYMLIYSLSCSCSYNLSLFWFIIKQQWTIEEISTFSNSSHLEWRAGLSRHNFERDPVKEPPCQALFNLVQGFQRRRFKCESLRRQTQSDGKSSPGLWPGELKIGQSETRIACGGHVC